MLREDLDRVGSVAIVGLEKNTGKTTVLNHLIGLVGPRRPLLLTSIGYDGESVDQVTGTDKPRIRVPAGTLVATARGLLGRCPVEKEILETTGFATPLGEVILFRALDDGYVELAGPSVIADMKALIDGVRDRYEVLVLIDGALSRLSSAGHGLAEAVILCTGASVDDDFDRVMAQTVMTAEQLRFPGAARPVDLSRGSAWLQDNEVRPIAPENSNEVSIPAIRSAWRGEATLVLTGFVSDRRARALLDWAEFIDRTVILEDPTRLRVTPATFDRLRRRGIAFEVMHPVELLAIVINPWSPRGHAFDEARAIRILEAIGVPVINVRREEP